MEFLARGPGGKVWRLILDADLIVGPNTANDATVLRHGFVPKLSGRGNEFFSGVGVYRLVADADLVMGEAAANNATIGRHGFAPALSGDPNDFLNGLGVYAVPSGATRTITFAIDGGGAPITTGIKADVYVPYACTIVEVTMLADQVGSIVVDIWKDAYANYPPTDADSITAAVPPTIAAGIQSQDATLTDWSTAIAAGDVLRFNVDSNDVVERLSLVLTVEP